MGLLSLPEREARVVRTRFGAAMAPKVQQSKEAKALAAANSSKGKKKKWSKGKLKEKVNNQVLMDEATHEKLYSEVPKYKLITISILRSPEAERLPGPQGSEQ